MRFPQPRSHFGSRCGPSFLQGPCRAPDFDSRLLLRAVCVRRGAQEMNTAGWAECKEKLCTVGQMLLDRALDVGTSLEQFSTMEFVIEPGCTCRKHDTAKTQTVVNDDQQAYAHAEAPTNSDGMLYSAFVPPSARQAEGAASQPSETNRSARGAAAHKEKLLRPEEVAAAYPTSVADNFKALWAEPEQVPILPRPPSTVQTAPLVSTAVRDAPWSQFMPPQPAAGRPLYESRPLQPGGVMNSQALSSPTEINGTVAPTSLGAVAPTPSGASWPAAPQEAAGRTDEEEFSKFMIEEDNISHISEVVVPKITVASTPAEGTPPTVKVPAAAALAQERQAPAEKPAPSGKPAPAEKPAPEKLVLAEKAAPAEKTALAEKPAPAREAEKARRSSDAQSAIVSSAQPRQSGTLKMGSKGATKSVLSQSMVMQSSAAATLGFMLQAQTPPPSAPAKDSETPAKETQKPAERSKSPPAARAAAAPPVQPVLREKEPQQPVLQEKEPQKPVLREKEPQAPARAPAERKPRDKSSDLKSTLSVNTNLNSSAANVLGPLAAAGARGRGSSSRRSGDLKSTLSTNAPTNSAAATALSSVMSGSGGSSKRESSVGGSSKREGSADGSSRREGSAETRTRDDRNAGKREDAGSQKDASSVGSKPKASVAGSRAKVDSKSVISGLNTSSSAAASLLGPMMAQQGKPKKRSDRHGGESKSVIA
mmetsp:Transcript_95389/g.179396  ORF Transcript_95389/g.179396 Transcript_95389/m.179396 type:complete len:708 (+) Transcript_95389:1-2124(+)